MKKWLRSAAGIGLVLFLTPYAGAEVAAPAVLPIYLEDNHSGSFFHLAATLDLDEPHALVLIDTHSDASPVAESDSVRDGLRRVRSVREREANLKRWRRDGTVQAFNWIEPLMPLPFSSVWWVAPESLPGDARAQEKEARAFLDSRLEFETRRSGELGKRFHRVGLEALATSLPKKAPVVVSIDLDYFAAMPRKDLEKRFQALWSKILTLPRLQAITLCVSRPWLVDDEQAFTLCQSALAAALSLRNATLRFEPFAIEGPDSSEKAKGYYRAGKVPPRFDITSAPTGLRSLVLAHEERLQVRYSPEQWRQLLEQWKAESGRWRIVVEDAQPSTDGIWRMRKPTTLRIVSEPRQPVPPKVRWLALRPDRKVYNVLPDMPSSKMFAKAAPPLVRDIESGLAVSVDGALTAKDWSPMLDARTAWGSVRLVAEVSSDGESWERTPEIELRVFTGEGFRAGLSEQFNLPYVFGAGFLKRGGETGPETLAGNDCANFLVYAWRRSGHRLPWCDPRQLSRHLKLVAGKLGPESQTPISAAAIDRGLAVQCGKHAAAVWEDREPLGILDGGDIVAHHLSGPPELISLRKLLKARPSPIYDLLEMPAPEVAFRLVAGGDISLHGLEPAVSPANPLRDFPSFVKEADLAVANLECALTSLDEPAREKPFLFRTGPEAAGWLHAAGLDALSLANNHSGDFGAAGLEETAAALGRAKLGHFGNTSWTIETAVGKLAFFGISFIENDNVELESAALARGMAKAAASGAAIVVLPHWGREYTGETTESQRRRARWLIDRGADIIIGSHTHHVQPLDFYRGRPIYYSLGNAFFPGKDGPKGFHEANWARIDFGKDGGLRVRLDHVRKDVRKDQSGQDE